MLSKDVIEKLVPFINDPDYDPSTENSNPHFISENIDSILYNIKNNVLAATSDDVYVVDIEKTKEAMTVVFSIDYNKGIANTDLNKFLTRRQSRHMSYMMEALQEKPLARNIAILAQEWQSLAKEHNIDIHEEVNKILELTQEIDKNAFFSKLVEQKSQADSVLQKIKEVALFNPEKPINQTRVLKIAIDRAKDFFSDEDFIFNHPSILDLRQIIKDTCLQENIEQIEKNFLSIRHKIDNEYSHTNLSLAREFKHLTKQSETSNVASFMIKKMLEENNVIFSEPNPYGPYKQVYFFEDDRSMCGVTQKNEVHIVENVQQARKLAETIFCSDVSQTLRKKPTVAKFFNHKLKTSYFDLEAVNLSIDTYIQNEAILKQDPLFHLSNYENSLMEDFNDDMNKIIKTHKDKQYAHSIVSKKYLHLFDSESYTLIKQIREIGIEASVLQDNIGKKIAAFKTTEDFNTGLVKFLNSFNDFTLEAKVNVAQLIGARIVSTENNQLILAIDSFEQSKKLGSSSWCISRDNYYFESYAQNRNQYFFFNFNEKSTSNESMIGLTFNRDGVYYAAHLKNDQALSEKDGKNLHLEIIARDIKQYKELDDSVRDEYETAYRTSTKIKKEIGLKR